MSKTVRAASFAAALTLALFALPAVTSTAHAPAVGGHGLVSADGIGWDATPAVAVAASQPSGIGWD